MNLSNSGEKKNSPEYGRTEIWKQICFSSTQAKSTKNCSPLQVSLSRNGRPTHLKIHGHWKSLASLCLSAGLFSVSFNYYLKCIGTKLLHFLPFHSAFKKRRLGGSCWFLSKEILLCVLSCLENCAHFTISSFSNPNNFQFCTATISGTIDEMSVQ